MSEDVGDQDDLEELGRLDAEERADMLDEMGQHTAAAKIRAHYGLATPEGDGEEQERMAELDAAGDEPPPRTASCPSTSRMVIARGPHIVERNRVMAMIGSTNRLTERRTA